MRKGLQFDIIEDRVRQQSSIGPKRAGFSAECVVKTNAGELDIHEKKNDRVFPQHSAGDAYVCRLRIMPGPCSTL